MNNDYTISYQGRVFNIINCFEYGVVAQDIENKEILYINYQDIDSKEDVRYNNVCNQSNVISFLERIAIWLERKKQKQNQKYRKILKKNL